MGVPMVMEIENELKKSRVLDIEGLGKVVRVDEKNIGDDTLAIFVRSA
jgi:hypothetical protein